VRVFRVPLAFLTTQTNLANLQAAESQHMSKPINARLQRRDEKVNEQLMPLYDPTSRGGHHSLTNLVVCCERCNQTKGPLTAQEFEALLAFLRRGNFFVAKNLLARMRAGGRVLG
jgi:hypothetical protein